MSKSVRRHAVAWALVALGAVCVMFSVGQDQERQTCALDDASDAIYTATGTWESGANGGYGFEPWVLVADAAGGEPGFGQASYDTDEDLNSIGPGDGFYAWKTYARGVGLNRAVAYRAIAGGAALLANPYDEEALARHLVAVLGEGRLAQDLRRRGLERTRAMRWEHFAKANLAVYQSILGNGAASQAIS